jgi:hypothetical protein
MASLEALYQSELKPALVNLEAQRKTAKKKFVLTVAVIAAFNMGGLYIIAKMDLRLGFMWIPLFISLLPMLAWYAKYFKGYKDEFKTSVIAKIINAIEPGLAYDQNGMVPKAEFVASHLFAESPDDYSGDDLISGMVGRTTIQCSEIWVNKVEIVRVSTGSTSSGSQRTRKKHHPIFNGLFFVADFNKSFNGITLVLPDKAQKLLGGWGQALQKLNVQNGELIKLEDPEFEKLFVVYSQDQVEARYILSTSLMQRIVAFQQRAQKDIRLSFANNKLYLAIPFEGELFEPSLMGSLLDFAQVQAYHDDFKLATDIVAELNLNTRIWRKKQEA